MGTLIKHMGLTASLALGKIFPPQGTPVIGYHSISDDKSYISLAPEMFAVQMRWLKDEGYQGISLDRFISYFGTNGTLPEKAMVLTFDDGLQDFYTSAWPVLRQYGFTATVFVPTDYIGDKSRWYADYGLTPVPMLNWEEIRELVADGMDIQSHGCSHRPLSALSSEEIKKELGQSKQILEQGLGKPVEFFCCPQGAENKDVAAAIKAAGYKAGVGGGDGLFDLGDDPFRIRRQMLDYIEIKQETTARLSIKACARGTFAWYVQAKKRVKRYG